MKDFDICFKVFFERQYQKFISTGEAEHYTFFLQATKLLRHQPQKRPKQISSSEGC